MAARDAIGRPTAPGLRRPVLGRWLAYSRIYVGLCEVQWYRRTRHHVLPAHQAECVCPLAGERGEAVRERGYTQRRPIGDVTRVDLVTNGVPPKDATSRRM